MALDQKTINQLTGAKAFAEALIKKQDNAGKGMKITIGRYKTNFYWYMAPYAHAKDAVASGSNWYSLLEFIGIAKDTDTRRKKLTLNKK